MLINTYKKRNCFRRHSGNLFSGLNFHPFSSSAHFSGSSSASFSMCVSTHIKLVHPWW